MFRRSPMRITNRTRKTFIVAQKNVQKNILRKWLSVTLSLSRWAPLGYNSKQGWIMWQIKNRNGHGNSSDTFYDTRVSDGSTPPQRAIHDPIHTHTHAINRNSFISRVFATAICTSSSALFQKKSLRVLESN